jgi:hypothetical protein
MGDSNFGEDGRKPGKKCGEQRPDEPAHKFSMNAVQDYNGELKRDDFVRALREPCRVEHTTTNRDVGATGKSRFLDCERHSLSE